jgi:L-2-hydroxyglutarate oxidase LhgO
MDRVDVIVIGAGVIGLSIARQLAGPDKDVLVLERHDGFGRETSSRNSEVIHCGMYYGETLLRTTLCVRGNPLLYELCARKGIPHRRTGKIVVAVDASEEARVHDLLAQGRKNGVPGLRLIGANEIADLERHGSGTLGLFSPDSGIVDSHRLMAFMEEDAKSKGAIVAYGCTVTGIRKSAAGFSVEVAESSGVVSILEAAVVVNAAGLGADRIAAMAGIDCEAAGYTIHPCKGEYFRVSHRHRGMLGRLVYPAPTPGHLGAHAVLGLDGGLKIGPSSFHVDEIDYSVDPAHQVEFYEKARRFLPFLRLDDLSPDMAGIRPKLSKPGEPLLDYIIRDESDRGLPGLVNLVGMESPGLTACIAIAEMVQGILA